MKLALVALMFALPTFAQAATIECDNGHHDDDRLVQITINPKSRSQFINLQLWETGYVIPVRKVSKNGNTIAIVGQKLKGFAEGEAIETVVDALLIYDAKAKKLNATLAFDGFVNHAAEEFTCR